jgi:hypothetical protein
MRTARRAALGALLTATLAAAPPRPPAPAAVLEPPRLTRERMEASLPSSARFLFVYGTRDPAWTPVLRERARRVAERLFGGDSSAVRADRDLDEREAAAHPLVLLGGPSQNAWTARLAPALPVRFEARGFRWQDRLYDAPGEGIHLVWPNPLAPDRFLLLIAANSPAALGRRAGGFWFGAEDWRIWRDGELVRSGVFAQAPERPWRYDPALDRDRDRERAAFARGLVAHPTPGFTLRAPARDPHAAAVRSAAAALVAALDRAGVPAAPVTLTLYPSLERKGTLTRSTRSEHVDGAGAAHAALPFGRGALDLWSVAAARLVAAGADPASPWLRPVATGLVARVDGEPLARAVGRLYRGRALPSAAEAAARGDGWRSPLVIVPARAVLARALAESSTGRRPAWRALLAPGAPGTLDSLARACGADPRRVERRYVALADSLSRVPDAAPRGGPRPWRPADGFMRGACLAHAVSLEDGYLSASCARELAALRAMGADWVSITPFAYLPDRATPELHPSADGGPDEENDESIVEAAARARSLGLRVWLAPHLWTRGWVGELDFGARWPRFFERYRGFALHHALLAQREGIDGLVVGHELVTASLGFPDRWRALIGDVRGVYDGTLTYGANWGEEVEGIAFWDALDVVSVSFYDPLAGAPTTAAPALRAGAAKALARLGAIARRTGRPVLIGEVGYAPHPAAPVRPWEEDEGAIDLEAQRACYAAFVAAAEPHTWIAGALWWKWYTNDRGGPRDGSFTPRGKPAESVLRASLRSWAGRPVVPPRAR